MTDTTKQVLVTARQAYDGGQFDRAAELSGKVLAHLPGQIDALLIFGLAAAKLNQPDASVRSLGEVLEQAPGSFEALIGSGMMLHQLGRFEEARAHFERAIEVDATSIPPYVGILRGHKMKEVDRPFLDQAINALSAHESIDDEVRQLMYAVAKAYDDLGEYERAIGFYDLANRTAAQLQKPKGMDRAFHSLKLNEMMRVFARDLVRRNYPSANQTKKPIFILGMIRSGTTLVEQILSRHPSVHAGGELRFWVDNGFGVILPGPHGFNAEFGEFLGLEYLSTLQKLALGEVRVTDKMPMNYMLVGLIHLLFPNASIIHCQRNPIDTCLSIYMTPYAAPPDFAYNRDDIAFGYREYQRVMAHWIQMLPVGRMLDVKYEALVDDPEPNIRRMLEYCGLSWDTACLSPEQNERVVDTPSKWQVRQPMYKTSVGRAQHYAPWLGAIGELTQS
jgi:tetratricopeptide (TPR) repeat protein